MITQTHKINGNIYVTNGELPKMNDAYCSGKFNLEEMLEDKSGELFCDECAGELFPIMEKEYQDMVKYGEIELD